MTLKMIILSVTSDAYNTLYRMRGLLATLTAVARTTSLFQENAVQITGNAGDALVIHGLLWHQTAQNHASEPRVAVLINYTALTVKPMVTMGPFDDAFKAKASPALRTLLGFDHGAALRARLKSL